MLTKTKQWLRQFFCRHKKKSWYEKKTMFFFLGGDVQYLMCEKCGKQLDKRILEYEGNGYR